MKKDDMNESKQALKFGVGAGLIAVLCCVGPLIPILIGVGGATALFGLDQYKPVFIGTGLLLLAVASWYVVRKRNRCCATRNRIKDVQVVFLIFGVGIGSYLALQYGVVPILADVASNKIANEQQLQTETYASLSRLDLEIEGMTCAGCAVGVEQALLDVPGVMSAKVNWETGFGTVEYDRNVVSPEQILSAKVQEQYILKNRPTESQDGNN